MCLFAPSSNLPLATKFTNTSPKRNLNCFGWGLVGETIASEMGEGHLASLLTPYALFSFGAVIALTHINAKYSLCHMFLKGITFWMPPSDEEIAALPSINQNDTSDANNNLRQRKKKPTPQEPQGQLPIQLAKVGFPYLKHGYLYESFNQVFYISAISFANLFFAEVWACGMGTPANDIAFLVSVVACCYSWLCLVQTLFATGSATSRAVLCSAVSLLNVGLCFTVLFFADEYFEFGDSIRKNIPLFKKQLDELYKKANLKGNQGETNVVPDSDSVDFLFRLFLCAVSSLYSFATLTSAMREVQCHNLMVNTLTTKKQPMADEIKTQLWKMASYINLLSPILLALFWVPTLFEELPAEETTEDGEPSELNLFPSAMHTRIRLFVSIAVLVLRGLTIRGHVQAYSYSSLPQIHNRIASLNRQTGKILQNLLRGWFFQLPVITMELVCPIVIQLTLALLLKRKGDFDLGVCNVLLGAPKDFESSVATFTTNAFIPVSLNFFIWWFQVTHALNLLLAIVITRYTEWNN
eukprot:TRINITY_DN3702_c0_g2_i1.p1 TRINITY_DN3702_c0_g2~~TRINITY_DN3702_c0_g2_i1.p1  ORF type:complete len:525 (-),score=110.75 TRINITY_DN3702_c0_g2_i1:1737-3311(-)